MAWAKRIVTDFLDAAVSVDRDDQRCPEVVGLLSTEYAEAIKSDKRWSFLDIIPEQRYSSPKITSEEIAPNGSEIIFAGTMTNKKGREATFTVRVARESEKGKWSIRYFRLKEEEKPAK